MRRKRKDNSYLNKLVNKFRWLKAEPNKSNNKMDKADLRTKTIYSEISRFKQIEQALRRNRQEFIGLFKNSPEALAYTDMDVIVLEVNKRFEELFGYKIEEMRGPLFPFILRNYNIFNIENLHQI